MRAKQKFDKSGEAEIRWLLKLKADPAFRKKKSIKIVPQQPFLKESASTTANWADWSRNQMEGKKIIQGH